MIPLNMTNVQTVILLHHCMLQAYEVYLKLEAWPKQQILWGLNQ